MALIEVAGIHVRFGDRVVLESIDLAVPRRIPRPDGRMARARPRSSTLTGRVKRAAARSG
jgi:branched-chain amino acid transport system ATP-binding protein